MSGFRFSGLHLSFFFTAAVKCEDPGMRVSSSAPENVWVWVSRCPRWRSWSIWESWGNGAGGGQVGLVWCQLEGGHCTRSLWWWGSWARRQRFFDLHSIPYLWSWPLGCDCMERDRDIREFAPSKGASCVGLGIWLRRHVGTSNRYLQTAADVEARTRLLEMQEFPQLPFWNTGVFRKNGKPCHSDEWKSIFLRFWIGRL